MKNKPNKRSSAASLPLSKSKETDIETITAHYEAWMRS
jgi:hypothetical protein